MSRWSLDFLKPLTLCLSHHAQLMTSFISSVQSLSCVRLCDPMDCSTPGFPVCHQLPEFTQTHVHWVSDAIQPSHPLSSPSPPVFNVSQHQGFISEKVQINRTETPHAPWLQPTLPTSSVFKQSPSHLVLWASVFLRPALASVCSLLLNAVISATFPSPSCIINFPFQSLQMYTFSSHLNKTEQNNKSSLFCALCPLFRNVPRLGYLFSVFCSLFSFAWTYSNWGFISTPPSR